ncbi:hypothetical protein MMC10_011265 [Thelotrema lepadinum]|nr:hypothetical protein [Thelotrema lepadinum]
MRPARSLLGALSVGAVTSMADLIATTTIPWIGSYTASATVVPCIGTTTLVVQIPFITDCPVPTPSTTVSTTTTTPTSTPVPQPSGACLVNPLCAASGLDIDYYHNTIGYYTNSNLNPPVSPNYYITQGLTPLASSQTNETSFEENTYPTNLPTVVPDPSLPAAFQKYYIGWKRTVNGGITVDANNFTLVYQGFYHATTTGTYTFCGNSDNGINFFLGSSSAFSCLNGAASDASKPILSVEGQTFTTAAKDCATANLVAGGYYPFRAVMGDWQGPASLNLTVQRPGVAFADRTSEFAGSVYPVDCGIFV